MGKILSEDMLWKDELLLFGQAKSLSSKRSSSSCWICPNCLYSKICCNTLYTSPMLETLQIPINSRMELFYKKLSGTQLVNVNFSRQAGVSLGMNLYLLLHLPDICSQLLTPPLSLFLQAAKFLLYKPFHIFWREPHYMFSDAYNKISFIAVIFPRSFIFYAVQEINI